jgi:hypothetical protein
LGFSEPWLTLFSCLPSQPSPPSSLRPTNSCQQAEGDQETADIRSRGLVLVLHVGVASHVGRTEENSGPPFPCSHFLTVGLAIRLVAWFVILLDGQALYHICRSASRGLCATRLLSFRRVQKQLDRRPLMVTNCLLTFQMRLGGR